MRGKHQGTRQIDACADTVVPCRGATLAAMVAHYCQHIAPLLESELAWHRAIRAHPDFLRVAVFGYLRPAPGKTCRRHPHQRRVPPTALAATLKALRRSRKLTKARTFAAIHEEVGASAAHGFGAVSRYDTSLRIATTRGKGAMPKEVYLHAGTLRGAGHLGIRGKAVAPSRFPAPLSSLAPHHIENFLCIFEECLPQAAGGATHIATCASFNANNTRKGIAP